MAIQILSMLSKGDRFEGVLLCKTSDVKTSSNGSKYLDTTLCDRRMEINCKSWDWGDRTPPRPLSVVNVRAVANEYMGKLQLKIDFIEQADVSKANLSMLVPCAPEAPDDLFAEIYETIDEMEDDDIKLMAAAVVDMNKDKLRYWPAAVSFHHAMRGGLIYHTVSMLRAAKALLPLYPFLDKDLTCCGVIIHDICKIMELDAGELGLASEYTKEGLLLGHISMGTMYINSLAKELEIDKETALLLEHMVLSHHSEPDYGSPRRPMFAEAELLHHLDNLDARMFDMHHNISSIKEGEFTSYIRSLENRKLYRHKKFHE